MSFEIILIDDDILVCKIHEKLLKYAGFTQKPWAFFNGQSALDHILADDYKNKDYVILLDINMPIMDGWAFLEEIENIRDARVFIFVVSSSVLFQDSRRALSFSNVVSYIVKPLDLNSLMEIKTRLELKPCRIINDPETGASAV